MWDFNFLDAIFGGSSPQDGVAGQPQLKGWSPIVGWAVSYSMAGAGPFGQYIGLIYGSPGTGIPNLEWELRQARGSAEERPRSYVHGDPESSSGDDASPYDGRVYTRELETLDRDGASSAAAAGDIPTVNVFGSPREDKQRGYYVPYVLPQPFRPGGEIQLDLGPSIRPPKRRPPKRWVPPAKPSLLKKPNQPEKALPQPDPGSTQSSPMEAPPVRVLGLVDAPSNDTLRPPMADYHRPDDFLRWGAWEKPEAGSARRSEHMGAGPIETVPTMPAERSFWSRGGVGLVGGGVSVAAGVAILMWWNPVGWLAGASVALMLAGGIAASAGSAVQLGQSYAGNSSPEQDEAYSRANAAALAFSSPGGIVGGVGGTVLADDPVAGFETWALWGGLAEGAGSLAISLPGALRAIPGIWYAAMPWAKALLLSPMWFALGIGGARGSVRGMARVFAAQGRAAPRIRTIEHLGASSVMATDADWARYQTRVLRSREEAVFRVTFQNGSQSLVYADGYLPRFRVLREAKFGDMGMMYIPEREAHIMNQAGTYVKMAEMLGGRTEYFVSSELGASRLSQRFSLEFPEAVESGQLQVIWRP